jgi:N-acetylmuramoyl-L-alanine amidase
VRRIDNIVVHCTGTEKNIRVSSIQRYWRDVLGWNNPGYHVVIEDNGNIVWLHPVSALANGVRGHNHNSVHVCYIGGLSEDDRSQYQKISLMTVLLHFRSMFPNARILGHRDFLQKGQIGWKDCPQFDAINEYRHI